MILSIAANSQFAYIFIYFTTIGFSKMNMIVAIFGPVTVGYEREH